MSSAVVAATRRFAAVGFLISIACGGSSSSSTVMGPGRDPGPAPDPGPVPPPADQPAPTPTTGDIAVAVRTTGEALDPDGYTLTLDGQGVRAMSAEDQHILAGLPLGEHQIGLGGVADNCGVHQPGIPTNPPDLDPNPMRVRAVGSQTLRLEFIVFCLQPEAGKIVIEQANFRLLSIDAWGDDLEVLIEESETFDYHTNADARRVVFFRAGDVWISDIDGGNALQLTDTADDEAFPKLSPNGTRVAFNRFNAADNRWRVFIMNADGSDETLVIDTGQTVDWSPDGTRIAFQAGRIFVADADGFNATAVPGSVFGDATPTWAPDGNRIAFIRDRTIMIADLEAAQVEAIGEDASLKGPVTWSPDGRWIAYSSNAAQIGAFQFDTWVLPVAGGEPVRLMGGGPLAWTR